jgi:hypothetical protein
LIVSDKHSMILGSQVNIARPSGRECFLTPPSLISSVF